jgi:hypothetical protein
MSSDAESSGVDQNADLQGTIQAAEIAEGEGDLDTCEDALLKAVSLVRRRRQEARR